MKRSRCVSILAAGGAMILALNGWARPPSSPDTRAADEAAIRAADTAWSQGATSADGLLKVYADDAIVLAPNAPMASDNATRHKMITDLFATPGFSISWEVNKVEVARSGDIGYSLGIYEMSMTDASGKPMSDRGKYTTIWRKQPDGSWKAIVDMFNTDLPAAASK